MTYGRYETNCIDAFLDRLESDQRKTAQGETTRFQRLAQALRPPVLTTEAGGQFTLQNLAFLEGNWNTCYLNGRYTSPKRKEKGNGERKEVSAVLRVPKIRKDWFYAYFDRFSRLATEELAGHLNIVRMYEYGRDGKGLPYQIFAREPADLFQVLAERQKEANRQYTIRTDPNVAPSPKTKWGPTYFGPAEIVRKMHDLLESAEALESLGFLQVDWKPENVLVGEDGGLIATDLDFLLPLSADVETIEQIAKVNTPEYRAPETQSMAWYDVRSSIYQLGLIFHSLMTLSMVISRNQMSEDRETVEKAFAPAEDWLAKIYPHWIETVKKATAYAPQDRYQTFQEFREGIEAGYQSVMHPPSNVSLTSSPSVDRGQ
ncbi:TPA: hypothetical protein HA249_04955 [Candidatus Woesearchaeota archaeon]|nr:MAG: Serine/threonine-protein kinase [archaeon GW2011_AR16]HIG96204.1 hypothetical protein [Candidatus Woesearchaeota archaeon]HIH47746.1 hypothetical protein [Candidatus Woesearchaeota archaeon]HII88003.1 hypothetical protein [Candidatus Woesearchaeota archaeon]